MARDQHPTPDPLKQMMDGVLFGFKKTQEAMEELRARQDKLAEKQKEQAQAAYQGMTGSGKSRYVTALVEIEKKNDPRGAQTRVAELLDLTPGRVSQLVHSDKNRKNGK